MMAAQLSPSAVSLGDLVGAEAGSFANMEVSGLALDSRDVAAGTAFFALAGRASHGLDHARAAIEAGAVVVLFDPAETAEVPAGLPAVAVAGLRERLGVIARRFHGGLSTRPWIAGITGTNGKTTVAWLVAQSLDRNQGRAGYIGTLGYGRPSRIEAHRLTTPDCLSLHREIASMSVANVALEVSSHAIDQNRLAGIDVTTAVFTNLSRDHLDEHGDFARYAAIKAALFRRSELAHAVLNLDDPFAHRLTALIGARYPIIGVSFDGREEADLRLSVVSTGIAGTTLEVRGRRGRARFDSRLIGDFNAENLALALGTLIARGLRLEDAASALAAAAPPPGRMEVFGDGRSGPGIVVDYAHTPDGLRRALEAARQLCNGELHCVFGCGGDRDRGKRRLMGEVAGKLADTIVLTNDNPRSEDPLAIIEEIRAGLQTHDHVIVEPDRKAAIENAVAAARPGDLVLVAGKGHERAQETAGVSRAFDDRALAAELTGTVH